MPPATSTSGVGQTVCRHRQLDAVRCFPLPRWACPAESRQSQVKMLFRKSGGLSLGVVILRYLLNEASSEVNKAMMAVFILVERLAI